MRRLMLPLVLLLVALPCVAGQRFPDVGLDHAPHEMILRAAREIPGRAVAGLYRRLEPGWDESAWIYLRKGMPPTLVDGISYAWTTERAAPTLDACVERAEEICRAAGQDGLATQTAGLALNADGSATCSAECSERKALAFVHGPPAP